MGNGSSSSNVLENEKFVLCTHSERMCFDQSLDFLVVVEIFLKGNFKLAIAINALKKLTKEE